MFFQELAKYANNTALIEGSKQFSYTELTEACEKCSDKLPNERGLGFLFCQNNSATVIAYLSCIQLNQSVLLLDANTSTSISQALIDSYQPTFIIKDGQVEILREVSPEIDSQLSLLLSTSGSTGSPKQVALSAKNLNSNALAIVDYLNITEQDVAISSLPLFYSYGLSVLNSHLAAGAAIVLTEDSTMSRAFWDGFEQHKVTSLAGVPHSYQMLLRLGFTRREYPHLRYITQAGGKLDKTSTIALAEYAQSKDLKFYIMYGQTEATARIAYLSPDKVMQKPDSIGQSIPGGSLHLQDVESGGVIEEANQPGELVYRGDNIMLGYVTNREDIKSISHLQELKTGDLAFRDNDGDYFITGRLKRIVKIVGKRTSLDEVERLLEEQGIEAKALGNDDRLDIVSADSLPEKLNVEIGKQLGLHPSFICCHSQVAIPLTDNGKTDYQAIERIIVGGE